MLRYMLVLIAFPAVVSAQRVEAQLSKADTVHVLKATLQQLADMGYDVQFRGLEQGKADAVIPTRVQSKRQLPMVPAEVVLRMPEFCFPRQTSSYRDAELRFTGRKKTH